MPPKGSSKIRPIASSDLNRASKPELQSDSKPDTESVSEERIPPSLKVTSKRGVSASSVASRAGIKMAHTSSAPHKSDVYKPDTKRPHLTIPAQSSTLTQHRPSKSPSMDKPAQSKMQVDGGSKPVPAFPSKLPRWVGGTTGVVSAGGRVQSGRSSVQASPSRASAQLRVAEQSGRSQGFRAKPGGLSSNMNTMKRLEQARGSNPQSQNDPNLGPPLPSTALQSASATQQVDNSVQVLQQDVTYNIGQSANVHLHTGANMAQQGSSSRGSELLHNMNRSKNAEYDMTKNVARGPCTHNTRTIILQKMDKWSRSGTVPLYWLTGIAGTGKTTLAFSISKQLKGEKRLGASFFCSRSVQDCRDTNLILPTIAYQLAMQYLPFKEALASALENDADIFNRNLEGQLHKLIIDPWQSCAEVLPRDVVIVLDALDECEGGQTTFLQTLFDNATKLPFKLLITSRPDFVIRDTMKTKDGGVLSTFILHEVEKDLVEADIAKYLEDQLSGRVPSDIIDELKILAGALFIVATTLAKLFTGGNINARERFHAFKTLLPAQRKVLASLDELYLGVLCSALGGQDVWEVEVQNIKDVLHMIVCARDPLTQEGLAGILGVSVAEVERRLDSLHSVILIPEDRSLPIIILHASFADFMQDVSRSGPYYCYPHIFHLTVTKYCLRVLNDQLHQNLYGTDTPPSDGLSGPSSSYIGPSLRYAAVYWVNHLALSDPQSHQTVFDTIYDLFVAHGLHWIQCLTRLSRLPVGIQALESLVNKMDLIGDLAALSYEYLRFVQFFCENIEADAANIYQTIRWIPLQSPIRQHYVHLLDNTVQVTCGLQENWPSLERTINIHSSYISSIAISQDGTRMASGSNDKTIRIWNIRRHVEEFVLTGHTDYVRSVAITRDGSRVVSGSVDRTVRVWDVATSKAVLVLKASGWVLTVAISSDEKRIAAGGWYSHIQIWDSENGQLFRSLNGHSTGSIRSICFIPNTDYLVSGSHDKTARIWNVPMGKTELILREHTNYVWSVACSPAGDRIVTGSDDGTACLWNISGQKLQTIHHDRHSVNSVAFMPDGTHVVTGVDDGTVHVWDADTGHRLHVSNAAGSVSSVAAFPDGSKIASSSGNQINIWSMRSAGPQTTKGGRSGTRPQAIKTESMVFSSDGQRALLLPSLEVLDATTGKYLAVLHSRNSEHSRGAWSATRRRVAATSDKEIEVWTVGVDDVIEGSPLSLKGHSDFINHVSFSLDGQFLVSASDDHTARVWDAATGQHLRTLNHPGRVYSASFSHDHAQLVSDCNNTIHIWNAQTGEQLCKIDISVTSITFSSNDQYLITYEHSTDTTAIWDAQTRIVAHEHKGFSYWVTLNDSTSYSLSTDGWVCQFARLNDIPQKLFWIPHQYRPNIHIWLMRNNPIFSQSSHGVQVCLPRTDGLVTLLIPHGYQNVSFISSSSSP